MGLPNQNALPRAEYAVAQRLDRGWALAGAVRAAAPMVDTAMAAAFALFVLFTSPANQATAYWTVAPDRWAALRRRRERSHAADALLACAAPVRVTGGAAGVAGRR